jgi:imidazolonepropionase-like amidohydrolase
MALKCAASAPNWATVELGKLADLSVVGANPLEDITNVRRV